MKSSHVFPTFFALTFDQIRKKRWTTILGLLRSYARSKKKDKIRLKSSIFVDLDRIEHFGQTWTIRQSRINYRILKLQ